MGDNLYDNWGELYQSETKNIMSYPTHRECRTKFTNQQIAVMNYSIQNDKYYKNWNLANPENIKFTVDAFEPDNSLLMSTDISYNMEQKHTLHKCIDGKKGKFLYQDIDYFKLDYNEIATREVIIQISKGDYGCESVQIQLFDASNSILHEKTGNLNEKNIEISLKNIKQGSYFIKISNSTHSKELEDYKIILKKL